MRLFTILFFITLFINLGCKKVYPTTIVHNDTTIVVHRDTTIVIHNDTTIIQTFDTTILQNGQQQISFGLGGANSYYDTILNVFTYPGYNFEKFNIDYYPTVDSVILRCYANITKDSQAIVSLYNVTDKEIIQGSSITVTGAGLDINSGVSFQTGNLLKSFPHKEISLALAVKNVYLNTYTQVYASSLYLYSKP